ncbi:alpha-2-macroglobulin family protein [Desertibaculum subflavum]|uniref:alpha-2-macroglobulin family protein n=1 Tax=Desertibaculum subflavum TaxID=2268458 RepID=UPI0013C4C614
MAFAGVQVEYDGETPEACLRFTQALAPEGQNYRDFLDLRQGFNPAVRVDGDRLCLAGLQYGTEYQVTIRAGLPAASGARTTAPETVPLSLAERPPYIGIVGSGFVLPREGSSGLPVETINLDRVEVQVLRIGDRALPTEARQLLANRQLYRWTVQSIAAQRATLLWQGQMDVARRPNQRVVTSFPIAEAIKERKPGAYLVVVSKPGAVRLAGGADTTDDEEYEEDYAGTAPFAARLIVETDTALTTLQGQDGTFVFARSILTAKPLAGIELALISAGNDELARGKTDADGRLKLDPGLLRGAGGAAASMLLAFGGGGDLAVLDLRRPAFDFSDRGVTGRPSPGPLDAYLYADRGIYRPGETVHLVALLRDAAAQAVEGLPLTLAITRPNGVEYRRLALEAKPAGGFQHDFTLPESAARGVWAVTAHADPKGPAIGRVEVDVQDFVPERLKVTAATAAKRLRPTAPLEVEIEALFLYGAPAAELDVEAEIKLLPDKQPFPNLKGWQFGREDDRFTEEVVSLNVEATDAEGKAKATGALKQLAEVSWPLQAMVTVGVFEPSGRVVQDRVMLPFVNREVLLGIRPTFADRRVQEGSEAVLEVAAFDADGARIAREQVRWRLYKEWTDYTWYQDGGRWLYRSNTRDRLAREGLANIAADTPLQLREPLDWGRYRLVVDDAASGASSSYRFRVGWAPTTDAADIPDKVEVLVEKEAHAAGSNARVRIVPPGPGELMIAVAGDRIYETRSLSVTGAEATIEVAVDAAWGPGAYVLASWYRPLNQGKPRDPLRAVGLAWIGIDTSDRVLAVELGAPEKITPEARLSVPLVVKGVAAGETTFVTLAAVDEGILQLTRFVSPDPAKHYFGKRRLGIDYRDDYGRLLDGNAGPAGRLRSGGDGIGGAGLAVVPTRSVALFSGPIQVDAEGKATVALDVPDFVGQLRLMAVAYGKSKVGKGEGKVIVRYPLVADASFPRFLAPRDQSRMTLLVHNVEAPAGEYRLALKATGAVALEGSTNLAYPLAANERRIEAIGLVGHHVGIGTIDLEVTGPGDLKFRREWQIAVRSPHYPITLEQEAVQAPGVAYTVDPKLLEPFEPGSASVAVNYSTVRGIDVAGLVQSLDRYPYGCTEQITSRALPLVLAGELAALAGPTDTRRAPERKREVQKAIDTVLDRQDESGSVGLWRYGDNAAWPWVEAMAIELLIRAKEAGYVIPDSAVRLGLGRLDRIGRSGGERSYEIDPASARSLTLADRAYALAVLSQRGAVDIGVLRQLHDVSITGMRGTMGAALLGAALANAGDRGRAANAFREARAGMGQSVRGDYYGSPLRNVAGVLALAVESKAGLELQPIFDELQRLKRAPESMTTQEKLWLTRAAAAMLRDGELGLGVTGITRVTAKGAYAFRPTPAEIASGFTVTNLVDREAYRTVVVHGAPREAPPALGAGFTVEKKLFTLKGDPVEAGRAMQHDRILVSITAKPRDRAYRQAVLVDLLPAGWEIESIVPRGEDGGSAYPFLPAISRARLREARDDRLVAAVDVGPPPYRYYWGEEEDRGDLHVAYIARAVVPGRYTLPGAVVEDMYRAGFMGRTATMTTVVEGK